MRILFSIGFFPSKEHPFTSFIGDMAKAMVMNGHEVTVIAPQSITHVLFKSGKFLPKFEKIQFESDGGNNKHIIVYRPKVITFGISSKCIGKLTYLFRKTVCYRFLKSLDTHFDLVYAHFWECAYNVSDYVINNNLPLVVVSGEDRIVLTKFLNSKQIFQLRSISRKIICVSSKNKIESVNCGLCNDASCVVIPNGVNLEEFHPIPRLEARRRLGIDKNQFIISFVGRFVERKGACRIIQALELLKDPDIRGIFLGKSFNDTSQDPVGPYVAFKGVANHKDVYLYLSASDVYVLPTFAEGCSNSIVEAMACALPIISSNLPFNQDILDSSNSILINPHDINQIADAIKHLKDNPQIRSEMSTASLIKARELNFENRVDKILSILNIVKNEYQ